MSKKQKQSKTIKKNAQSETKKVCNVQKNALTQQSKTIKKNAQSETKKVCNVQKNALTQQSEYFIGEYERVRAFSIDLYASPEHWGELLDNAEHYAYIYHDRDLKQDGSPKEPHYHVLIRFSNAKTCSAVRKLTDIDKLENNTSMLFQRLVNPKSMYQYLMHKTEQAIKDKKTIYNEEEIITNDRTYWTDAVHYKSGENESFIEDLLNPQLNHFALAVKYGRDYIRNFTKYQQFALVVESERAKENTHKLRDELYSLFTDSENCIEEKNLLSTETVNKEKEIREILTNYISSIIIEMYHTEREYSQSSVSPSEVARSFLDTLNNEIITKVFQSI